MKTPEYKRVIYLSHPYGGLEQNKASVEWVAQMLAVKYPEYLFVSPIHAFGHLYNTVDYRTGLDYTLWLLDKCDEMWVLGTDWERSKGVLYEIDYCNQHNIPIYIEESNTQPTFDNPVCINSPFAQKGEHNGK